MWEIAKGTTKLTVLGSFIGTNGAGPEGGVTIDSSGNLYGTAVAGGAKDMGTVWEIAKGTTNLTAVASFNAATGSSPTSGVTIDGSGNLFGTTYSGGANGDGTVWEIAKGTTKITVVASFDGMNGATPQAGVTIDAAGNLYGTTYFGGAKDMGTVWEIAKGTTKITVLGSFDGMNGTNPWAGVTIDGSGNLFGTTLEGGAKGKGTVWEIAKGATKITVLGSFDGTNGTNPYGGVTIAGESILYGTAAGGGDSSRGTVWTFTVPEPSSLVLGLIGLALACIVATKRRKA